MPCSTPIPGADFFVERLGDTPIGVTYPIRINLMQVTKSIFQPRDIGYNPETAVLPGLNDGVSYSVTLLHGSGTLTGEFGPDITFYMGIDDEEGQYYATAILTVGDPTDSPLKFRLQAIGDPGNPLVPTIWDLTIRVYDPEYENEFGIEDTTHSEITFLNGDLTTGSQIEMGLYQIYKRGARGSKYPRLGILNENSPDPYTYGADIGPWRIESSNESIFKIEEVDQGFNLNASTGVGPTITPTYGDLVDKVPVTLTIKYMGDDTLPAEFAGLLDSNNEREFPICLVLGVV